MVAMVNGRNRMPVFKSNWEKHLLVMTLEQILPWDSGKKFIPSQIVLSYLLL